MRTGKAVRFGRHAVRRQPLNESFALGCFSRSIDSLEQDERSSMHGWSGGGIVCQNLPYECLCSSSQVQTRSQHGEHALHGRPAAAFESQCGDGGYTQHVARIVEYGRRVSLWQIVESRASLIRNFVSSPSTSTAVAGGCLAGTTWFAVYGLTGGFRNLKSPNVNVGYDHYPVSVIPFCHPVEQSVRRPDHRRVSHSRDARCRRCRRTRRHLRVRCHQDGDGLDGEEDLWRHP